MRGVVEFVTAPAVFFYVKKVEGYLAPFSETMIQPRSDGYIFQQGYLRKFIVVSIKRVSVAVKTVH